MSSTKVSILVMGVSTCERVVKGITVLNQAGQVIIGLMRRGGKGRARTTSLVEWM